MASLLLRSLYMSSRQVAPKLVAMNVVRTAKKCGGGISPKMLKLQKQFQAKDCLPVFLKGGSFDNILYRGTVGLALIGLLYTLFFLVSLII